MLYMDFAKAFDSVSHNELLLKLEFVEMYGCGSRPTRLS